MKTYVDNTPRPMGAPRKKASIVSYLESAGLVGNTESISLKTLTSSEQVSGNWSSWYLSYNLGEAGRLKKEMISSGSSCKQTSNYLLRTNRLEKHKLRSVNDLNQSIINQIKLNELRLNQYKLKNLRSWKHEVKMRFLVALICTFSGK